MKEYIVSYEGGQTATGVEYSPRTKLTELVRCKDCRSYFIKALNEYRLCCDNPDGLERDVAENDFCSYGVRKEG